MSKKDGITKLNLLQINSLINLNFAWYNIGAARENLGSETGIQLVLFLTLA